MFFERKTKDIYNIEDSYKDELIEKLKQENAELKKQLKFENDFTDGFVLVTGEYVVGTDIMPGRYSFKLIYGNDGRLETSGRNWVVQALGDKWNGISAYSNLTLKMGQKLTIIGNVKLLFHENMPVNINEDYSVIKEKNLEIEKLRKQIAKLKREVAEYKRS